MQIVTNIMLFTGILLFLCSCQYSGPVEEALRQSGKNRGELERVLDYYREKGDDLSLQAANFLISEMPGHHSLDNPSLFEFRQALDTMYPQMSNVIKKVVYQVPYRKDEFVANAEKRYDLEALSADYLIAHIDNVVEMWRNCSWLKDYSFEEFCEYLLPYRFACEPLLTRFDSTTYWWKEIKFQVEYYKHLPPSPMELRHFLHGIIDRRDDSYMQDFELPMYKEKHTFDCLDKCYYNLSTLRSAGIPCAIDYVPAWPTRNGTHYWWVLIDPLCMHNTYSDTQNPRAAKVLRQTYSHHPVPRPGKKEYIPEHFLNPFNKDVTAEYVKVSDVKVSFPLFRQRHAYLAVFNETTWKPIAWAKIRGGKAFFKDMGRSVVYLPVCYKKEQLCSAGNPILLKSDGSTVELNPKAERFSLTLTRKYPLTYSKTQWSRNMLDCRFEADDDSTFRDSTVVFHISRPDPNLNYVEVIVPDSIGAFRFWRIIGPKRIWLGELAFYGKQGEKLSGRTIYHPEDKGETPENAFDNDELTYTNVYVWLGKDFERPEKVSKIRYISRTDANGIIPGMEYELMYFDRQWISAGRQTAVADSLVFGNLPAGALFWLRNLTEGREERIFTYDSEFDRIEYW